MKQSRISHIVLGLSLAALPFLGGCSQQNAGNSNPFLGTASAEPATSENELASLAGTVTNPPVDSAKVVERALVATNASTIATNATPELAGAVASEAAPVTELKPPPNVTLSPVLADVVKLVQSGVAEPVLLSYITNTTGYFALGADEIVYLNDLGMAGNLMTLMMGHDQELRELRMNAAQAAQPGVPVQAAPVPTEEPELAAAPSYVDTPAMEAEPAYVSDDYFYDTLAPYGSWVYVSGYGRCWRPTVVIGNPGWRPYCDRGRWVCTDTGWYWLSDYSWGATTFHYGRWFNHATWGWCWWPDTVWAPSWVSWRYSNDYCGWAPLPPTACYQAGFGWTYRNAAVGVSFGFGLGASAYAFVPWGSFCGPRPYQHCLPPNHANQVYQRTTPVNHFEAGGHGTVYNRGIAVGEVRERSRTEVRTVSIREETGRGPRAEQLDRDGRTLAVHRPNLIPASAASGSSLQPSGRMGSQRANEAAISRSAFQPVTTSLLPANRSEGSPVRSVGRPDGRLATSVVPPSAPAVATTPARTTPTRVGTQSDRQGGPRVEAVTANRAQRTLPLPVSVRTPQTTVQGAVPSLPAARVPQLRGFQSTPQIVRPVAPAQSGSVVVIGGRNNATQSAGRDYSVWSTPVQSPTPSPSVSPPQNNNTPQIVENSPARSLPNGSEYGRSQGRGAYSTYSAPQSGQVVPPSSSYTPRPTPSSPASSYTPRPAPSAPPAQATVPATSRSVPSQGRATR